MEHSDFHSQATSDGRPRGTEDTEGRVGGEEGFTWRVDLSVFPTDFDRSYTP